MAEGVDFDRHYGRCVLLFGIPYQYTKSHVLRARLDFMREKYQIKDSDFLTFDALRQSAQCVGRVIRSKTDYGLVILADSRYNRQDKRSKFPTWITQFMTESSLNLSTEVAVSQAKTFLREMGQPIDDDTLHTILMTEDQVKKKSAGYKSSSTTIAIEDVGFDGGAVTEVLMNIASNNKNDNNDNASSSNSMDIAVEEF